MKKVLAIALSVLMLMSLTACGGNGGAAKLEGVSAPVDILNTVAASYTEDERIPGEPMAVEAGDTDSLNYMLHCSEEAIGMIDSTAHYVHMMMANNFTAGSYKLKEGTDKSAFVAAMETSIDNTQWMCGFPEKLIIATLADDYAVVVFGAGDLVDNFKTKLTAAYSVTEIAVEKALA